MGSAAFPVLAYVATILAGSSVAQSSFATVTLNFPNAWEIRVPFRVQQSQVSNDPMVFFYRSYDGGSNFESQPTITMAIPNTASGFTVKGISVPGGIYAVKIGTSGPSTQTYAVQTIEVVTAVSLA